MGGWVDKMSFRADVLVLDTKQKLLRTVSKGCGFGFACSIGPPMAHEINGDTTILAMVEDKALKSHLVSYS